jgi:site-specific DNA-methyltransferase (adenine-specific)
VTGATTAEAHAIHGEAVAVMHDMIADGVRVHAVVTDPPYHLQSIVKRFGKAGAAPAKHGTDGAFARTSRGFMGQQWDGGDVAFRPSTWRACFDLLPPGGHLVAFGGSRTWHRIAAAIEDAGFEIRDSLMWLYGSGMAKSHNVGELIDKHLGAERKVVGTSARRVGSPETRRVDGLTGSGTFAERRDNPGNLVTAPATDEARMWDAWELALKPAVEPIILARRPLEGTVAENVLAHGVGGINVAGCRLQASDSEPSKWPPNVLHDGSRDVRSAFLRFTNGAKSPLRFFPDLGDAESRLHYSGKANAEDRRGLLHPTTKPVGLIRWLVRLVTPPGGTVLDPFAGSGTTGEAALLECRNALLIEQEEPYFRAIGQRLAEVQTEHVESKPPLLRVMDGDE